MKTQIISVDSLSTYKGNGKSIFENIHFTINSEETVVLTGASGCGKSTLMRTLLGGHVHWSGDVKINGFSLSVKELAQLRKQVAYIPQQPRLPLGTVREYIEQVLSFESNDKTKDAEVTEYFELFSLPLELLKSEGSRLSGGERQRVATVVALLLNRPIIFADEITSALDPHSKSIILDHIFSLGKTILSVSHDPEWIALCSRTIVVGEKNG